MFVEPGTKSDVLRQGDIIKLIQVLGTIAYEQVTIPRAADRDLNHNPQSWSVQSPPKFRDCMVLTHCCELDPNNESKLTSIILAPLRDVHTATNPEKLRELIESNDIRRPELSASYLKYFYIQGHPSMQTRGDTIVDFSKCFSVRNKSYKFLAKKKILQLRDSVRASMSLKLALYFHRADSSALAVA